MSRWIALFVIALATGGAGDGYRRADWPHWVTSGCKDTRQLVLIRDSRVEPGLDYLDAETDILAFLEALRAAA